MKVKSKLQAGSMTVYGADWCGWTTKQRENLDSKGIDYNYVDCGDGNCPDIVKAFPTLVFEGFNEF